MKATKRSSDAGTHGDGYGYGNDTGAGCGNGHAVGKEANFGRMGGSFTGGDWLDFGWEDVPVVNDNALRTTRVFRCPGCIGGYECSIHGRRL